MNFFEKKKNIYTVLVRMSNYCGLYTPEDVLLILGCRSDLMAGDGGPHSVLTVSLTLWTCAVPFPQSCIVLL